MYKDLNRSIGFVGISLNWLPKKNMNLLGYIIKIYNGDYRLLSRILPPFGSPDSFWMTRSQRSRRRDKGLSIVNEQCNTGDPLETSGGLYRGPPSMLIIIQ